MLSGLIKLHDEDPPKPVYQLPTYNTSTTYSDTTWEECKAEQDLAIHLGFVPGVLVVLNTGYDAGKTATVLEVVKSPHIAYDFNTQDKCRVIRVRLAEYSYKTVYCAIDELSFYSLEETK